jgi:hypothetical protein
VYAVFDLKMACWIDGGDDFFSVHHKGVRWKSVVPNVHSRCT